MPVSVAPSTLLASSAVRAACCFGLAAAFVILGNNTLQNAVANGETRSLSFHHTHRDDNLTITFKRDGRYDEDALRKLNTFLRDWRTDDETRMDPKLFDILWEIQREFGGNKTINIVSSYRSPKTNAMLRRRSRGVAQFSQHMLGKAIDFHISGVPVEDIRVAGLRLQRGGVGYYPGSFVHVDTGNVRHWPRMTHDQLARVFPNGRTVHVPTDGHPLPGYALAAADLEKRTGRGEGRRLDITTDDQGRMIERPKRSVFGRLFGAKQDEDEDAETTTPLRGSTVASAPAAKPDEDTKTVKVGTVRMPPVRPREATPAKPAETFELASASSKPVPAKPAAPSYELASASSTPVPAKPAQPAASYELASASSMPARPARPADSSSLVAAASPSASEVINQRGYWGPTEGPPRPPAPVPPVAVDGNGQRLVWNTGPAGQQVAAVERPTAAERPAAGAIRPRAGTEEITPETTASLTMWNSSAFERKDRVPPDLALAYAAHSQPDPVVARPAPPMGAAAGSASATPPARPARTPVKAAAVAPMAAATVAAKAMPATRAAVAISGDPWLRGLVVAPSVHYSMNVTMFGTLDYRSLRGFIHKPVAMVAMTFSDDPNFGTGSTEFSGNAVAFLPTMTFTQRTAGLH